jgi:hypothetical protein
MCTTIEDRIVLSLNVLSGLVKRTTGRRAGRFGVSSIR